MGIFRKVIAFLILLTISLVFLLNFDKSSAASPWYDYNWSYRKSVTIDNSGNGSDLTNYQTLVSLDSNNFDFTKAKDHGEDIRFTSDDAVSLIDYWVESYDKAGESARIWVEVPLILASSSETIYLYYGNLATTNGSSGDDTFEFFDDFEPTAGESLQLGYYPLSSAQTVMTQDQGWEVSAPHTLSMIEYNSGGYKYWGYYGLQADGTGAGLVRSNDLITWDKYGSNPLFTSSRWPSVQLVGDTIYMVYTKDFGLDGYLVMAKSTDGINFTTVKTVVPEVVGEDHQNPSLFHNPNDGKYYLYWFSRVDTTRYIMVKSASNIEDLDLASSVTIITSVTSLAAPNMMYRDGTYYLSTEYEEGVWKTRFYTSTSPTEGFTQTWDSPVLESGSACLFQHMIGNIMHGYYCKKTGSTWTLDYRTADLSAEREERYNINYSKWTNAGGTWLKENGIQHDGSDGIIIKSETSARQMLYSNYSGSDYILEGYGKQISGRTWGFGVRVNDINNMYNVNLYEDLDAGTNLYLYRRSAGVGGNVSNAAVGAIDFDTWYKITAKVFSNNFEVYFNDVLKIQTTNSLFASGKVALFGETNTVAEYDELRVRKYTSVEPTSEVGSEIQGDTIAPSLNSINITNGKIVSGLYQITADVSDSESGVDRVEFYIDNELVGSSSASPYFYDWDTTKYHSPHVIRIVVYDNVGNVFETSYNVMVANELPDSGKRQYFLPIISLIALSLIFGFSTYLFERKKDISPLS